QLPIEQRATLDRSTRTITQQVESLMQMVNEFANYARPVEMNPIEVDLNELIGDVIELHRNSQQVVNYHLELDGSIPMLMLDTGRLRQIMNNLIINALDALENSDDPTITITTTLAGKGDGWVEISIQDNGPGIPDNLLDQVFEPYVTSKPKGTGLGLAIVTRIVEELGGVIRAYNNSLGAMMTIALPYRLLASIQEKPDQKGKQ
ncbi:MAG: ATP-binding protein, partial [Arenicellales bacterium]|nr:ATP-binding protein [Arenicellales bacterium]